MPQKDGFAVLVEIKAHPGFCYIPVIVQSALDNPDIIAKAFEMGAYDYFIKPVGLTAMGLAGQNLYLKVRNAISNYSLHKQMLTELTERRRTERILRLSEERYRAIFNQSYDAIGLFSVDTRKIVEANSRFSEMLGYTEAELQQTRIYDFIDEDVAAINESLALTLKVNKYLPAQVHRYRRKDGTLIYAESTGSFAMTKVEENVQHIINITGEEVATSDMIVGLISSVTEVISQTDNDACNMVSSSQQIAAAMATVSVGAEALSEQANELRDKVEVFVIE